MDSSERGRMTWLSSEDEGGPDVGMIVGLGSGLSLYVGELSRDTLKEAGVVFSSASVWVALHSDDGWKPIGPVRDMDAARELAEAVYSTLRALMGKEGED